MSAEAGRWYSAYDEGSKNARSIGWPAAVAVTFGAAVWQTFGFRAGDHVKQNDLKYSLKRISLTCNAT